MLSVLIPVYNYDIVKFASEIYRQCRNISGLDYEIICLDDASGNQELHNKNNQLNNLKNVRYNILEKNIGRSKIRNLLAEQANGEWLLFLDCDSFPKDNQFINNYLQRISENKVLCGGTVYQNKSSIAKEFILHWKNGKLREENKHHFTTNNFFIQKKVFQTVKFDESLTSYGHEDTVFGKKLIENNFIIDYIDNPVFHLGLKTTDKFLSDILSAETNLNHLYFNAEYSQLLSDLNIIKAYNKLRKYRLTSIFSILTGLFQPLITKQLHSANPNLHLLDLYKLKAFTDAGH